MRVQVIKYDKQLNELWHLPLWKIFDVVRFEIYQVGRTRNVYQYKNYYVYAVSKYGNDAGSLNLIRLFQSEVKELK